MIDAAGTLFGALDGADADEFLQYVDSVVPGMAHNVGYCASCEKNTLYLHKNVVSLIECPKCGKALKLSLAVKE